MGGGESEFLVLCLDPVGGGMWQEGKLGNWGIKGPVAITPENGGRRQFGTAVKVRLVMITSG